MIIDKSSSEYLQLQARAEYLLPFTEGGGLCPFVEEKNPAYTDYFLWDTKAVQNIPIGSTVVVMVRTIHQWSRQERYEQLLQVHPEYVTEWPQKFIAELSRLRGL